RGHFFMVADGMGAHAAGELASGLAVEGVPHLYHKYSDMSPPEALQKAIQETNSKVHRKGQENADFRNMGTTASMMLLLPQGAIVAHIGDSRVYRLREGNIEQLTFDHSLLWELRAAGQFSEDAELAQAIPKNVITRSLGPNSSVHADIEGPLPVRVGDTYLLCSDGLTGRIEDDELASLLTNLPLEEAGQMLLDLANLRGGPDNITVVLVKVVDEDLATPREVAEPIKIGYSRPKEIHPAIWACTAACTLGAFVLMLTHNDTLAAVAVVGAVIALLVGFISRSRSHQPGEALVNGRRLGKGPYAKAASPPCKAMADRLTAIATELRRSSAAANSRLDWSGFDKHVEAARESLEHGQPVGAISAYAHAFRAIMQSIRDNQNGHSSDSVLDL
ncbi:MAG: PP2C family serine/threonine-protein phosphatase, partial [Pirellulaceae bacterium]